MNYLAESVRLFEGDGRALETVNKNGDQLAINLIQTKTQSKQVVDG